MLMLMLLLLLLRNTNQLQDCFTAIIITIQAVKYCSWCKCSRASCESCGPWVDRWPDYRLRGSDIGEVVSEGIIVYTTIVVLLFNNNTIVFYCCWNIWCGWGSCGSWGCCGVWCCCNNAFSRPGYSFCTLNAKANASSTWPTKNTMSNFSSVADV